MTKLALAAAGLAIAAASSASAAVVFTTTFETASVSPGNYITVNSIEGWTGGAHGIEIQNNVAGTPAVGGGAKFAELDTNDNSSMFRTIGAGVYDLSFLYSPRPGVRSDSNGIEVWINNTLLGSYTGNGQNDTNWSTQNIHFSTNGGTLTFKAVGVSDSLGGYVDNIKLSSGVPEPATWALMLTGFGMAGVALRRRPVLARA